MKQFKFYAVIFLLLVVFVIPQIALASWWNPFTWNWNIFDWFSNPQNPTPVVQTPAVPSSTIKTPAACVPNWQCEFGPCKNGYQTMIATDSNNCGQPKSNVHIVCPALARVCSTAQ